jgi:hypothetical protein
MAAPDSVPAPRKDLHLTPLRTAILSGFGVATVLLIPLEQFAVGAAVWLASLVLTWRDPSRALRRRMSVLLGLIALLAAAPIHTRTDPLHFLTLGVPLAAAVIVPPVLLARTDPGVIRFRLLPRRVDWLDLLYVAMAFPLAYAGIRLYFAINPEMPWQWPLPAEPDPAALTRLFWGINAVGIWDELFFINTVFALLRSLFAYPLANAVQAVVYTAVLYDMAFIGIGPILVYGFALTQGAMFERSNHLLYVLCVHLIVDFFLYWAIVMGQYPDYVPAGLIH